MCTLTVHSHSPSTDREGWSRRWEMISLACWSTTLLRHSLNTLRVGVAFSPLANVWQSLGVNSNSDHSKFIPQLLTLEGRQGWAYSTCVTQHPANYSVQVLRFGTYSVYAAQADHLTVTANIFRLSIIYFDRDRLTVCAHRMWIFLLHALYCYNGCPVYTQCTVHVYNCWWRQSLVVGS